MYDEILDVAERLFMTQGYHATSTRQITDCLGVTQPTLYYHFKKKEDIYYEVMVRLSNQVRTSLLVIVEQTDVSFEQKITEMIRSLKQRHPFNLFMMMHDIEHMFSASLSQKLYALFLTSYKQPFIELFTAHRQALRATIDIELAVSQLFIFIAAIINQGIEETSIKKQIDLFLHGVLD